MSATQPEQRIENYVEATHAIVTSHEWLHPDGSRSRPIVNNPELNRRDPSYLRVSVPRKGMTFKVIEAAEEVGLRVADVWQLDDDYEEERIVMKFEPEESDD